MLTSCLLLWFGAVWLDLAVRSGPRYIFGGRRGGGDQQGLNDLWRLDPGHVSEQEVRAVANQTVVDASHAWVVLNTTGDGAGGANSVAESKCILKMEVELTVPHRCLRDVRLSLLYRGERVSGFEWQYDDMPPAHLP